MEIKTRKTVEFIELEVDEIETTIFKHRTNEIKDQIYNLLQAASDLASYTTRSLSEFVDEFGF